MIEARIAWDQDAQRIFAVGLSISSNDLSMATLVGTTWTPVTDKRPTSGAQRTPAAFDPRRGTTVVLDSAAGTFEWNGRGWTHRVVAGPNARDGVALAHDPVCGATLSFAGGAPGSKTNDVYRFPDATGKPAWVQLAPTGALPPVRTHHAMTYDADRHVFVVFGGSLTGVEILGGDTWELASANCSTWTWTERTPASGPALRRPTRV